MKVAVFSKGKIKLPALNKLRIVKGVNIKELYSISFT
jgi:hypothetical protein